MDDKDMKGTTPDKERKIKKVERTVLSLLMAAVVAAGAFVAGWFGRWGALGKTKRAILEAIDTMQENYYKEVDEDEFYNNLFKAFNIDPYSAFYTKEEMDRINAESKGQNFDTGFSVYKEESRLQVLSVTASSSAETAGIEAGMNFFKFGKSEDDWKDEDDKDEKDKTDWSKITAEDYFRFVALLGENDEYVVRCGTSAFESEATTYTVQNGEKGAGISLTREYDPMRIYQVTYNSPAYYAGLQRGMYILKYGESKEELTSGFTQDFLSFFKALVKKTAAAKKTEFTLYLQCSFDKEDGDAPVKEMTVKFNEGYLAGYCYYRDSQKSYRILTEIEKENGKEKLVTKPVETEEPIEGLNSDTAYISIAHFTGNAAKEFKDCLDLMKENKRTNLILDLRGNGGGQMNVFAEIAGYLLKDATAGAQKVAYAKFRDGSSLSYSVSGSSYKHYFEENSRVYVLADENTASASECLIGALVDYGTIGYGDIFLREDEAGVARTYGKGIMQHYYDVTGGNALKLTVAEIFWPKSKKSIHGVGVTAEGDGAEAIKSSLLPDEKDSFLQEALARIQRVTTEPNKG